MASHTLDLKRFFDRFRTRNSYRAHCQQCGHCLSEWFVCRDEQSLDLQPRMWCYGGCKQISPWPTHTSKDS